MATSEADAILRSLRRIMLQVSGHSRSMLRDTGLTLPQLLALRALGGADGMHMAQLSDALQLSRSTVSGIVDRLVRAGLVERQRSASDRRRVEVHLSEQGARRLADAPAPLQVRFEEGLSGLPDEERELIRKVLDQVCALMEAQDVDAGPLLSVTDTLR